MAVGNLYSHPPSEEAEKLPHHIAAAAWLSGIFTPAVPRRSRETAAHIARRRKWLSGFFTPQLRRFD
jgi:hypothetical protein